MNALAVLEVSVKGATLFNARGRGEESNIYLERWKSQRGKKWMVDESCGNAEEEKRQSYLFSADEPLPYCACTDAPTSPVHARCCAT